MPTSRRFAIGDIHGDLRSLESLLERIKPAPSDQIVLLGDYVNRGLDSAGVLDLLIRLGAECRLIPLLSNHDHAMISALRQPEDQAARELWLGMGGQATLDSYDESAIEQIPEEHIQFLESCHFFFEDSDSIYVHGGAEADKPLCDQSESILIWLAAEQILPHWSGKMIICGHSPQQNGLPMYRKHVICLDTRAGSGGWLTCLEVNSKAVIQANEKGEGREIRLESTGADQRAS